MIYNGKGIGYVYLMLTKLSGKGFTRSQSCFTTIRGHDNSGQPTQPNDGMTRLPGALFISIVV